MREKKNYSIDGPAFWLVVFIPWLVGEVVIIKAVINAIF